MKEESMYKIISISNKLPDVDRTSFDSSVSLTDFDIVIVDPTDVTNSFPEATLQQDNKLYVQAQRSHVLVDLLNRRKSEFLALLNKGKMIVSFLEPLYEVKLNNVAFNGKMEANNYSWLPDDVKGRFTNRLIAGSGTGLKLVDKKDLFASYFSALQKEINFNAYIDIPVSSFELGHTFITNSADLVTGFSCKISQGIVVFLPKYKSNDDNNRKFIGVLLQIAKKFFGAEVKSPPPDWVTDFTVPGVDVIDQKISKVDEQIIQLNTRRSEFELERNHLDDYKLLLYEQGHVLERKVVDVLRLIGFKAETVSGENTDFDVILESKEGRAIAEVEGKDDNAIHKDKIDQLISAINQDAENKDGFAKGVLVGNHYRLKPIAQREEPFTKTVVNLAKQYNYALVTSADLYNVAVYLLQHPEDKDFKKACRQAIFQSDGNLVKFPLPK